MAVAILTLRRGTTTPSLAQSELFFNTSTNTLNVGGTSGTITLVKLGSNTGNITLNGNLSINGGISGSTLDITGNAKIDGNIQIGGNIVLGTGSNDIITVNAPFTGSLIPQEDGVDSLGSPSKRFKSLHVVSASIDNISLPGSGILSSSNENFGTFSQSVDSRLDNLQLFTSSQEDLNQTFATTGSNVFSGSQTITGSITVTETLKSQVYINPKTLDGFTVPDGHNAMLVGPVDINGDVTLEGNSSLLILDKITLPDGLLSSSTTDFDTFSSSLDDKFATLGSNSFIGSQTITGSLIVSGSSTFTNIGPAIFSGSVNILGSVTASVFSGSFVGTLPSQDSRLNNLEQKSASVDLSISSLNQYTSSLKTAISVNGSNLTVNGDLIVLGTTTQIDSTQVNIGENILELNYGGAVTKGGLYVKDATGTLTSGSMLWDSTIDRWVAGPSGSESVVLLRGGDNILSGSAQITASLDSLYLRKGGDLVVSGSSQIDITQTSGYTTFSSSFVDRLTSLELNSSSHDERITQLESDSGSQNGRISNLEQFTSSLQGVVSSSSDTSTITLSIQSGIISGSVIGGVVSGSNQLTSSLNTLYEVSGSVAQLVGIHQISGSLGSAAWYNVTTSLDVNLDTSSLNDNIILSAGATKRFVVHVLDNVINAADITSVSAGDGLGGGGTAGDVNLTLVTSSQHFIDGVNSTISTFSQSVDTRLDSLESFSSSLDGGFVTQQELGSATGSLIDSIATKLDTGSFSTISQSIDIRLDGLESFSASLDTAFVTQQELGTATASLIDSIATKLNTGSYNTDSQSFDSRLDNLEANSSSLNNLFEEKSSGTHTLVSGSSQLTGSLVDLVSNQTISGTKTFNDIVVNGTGSFAYITSVSGTAKIIGDAFIVVNTDTPTSRYAGLSVYDSGSTLSTASFYYDGETNDWGYEYSGSAGIDYAVTIFGPEYTTKGTPTYLTSNRVPKAVDNHHLNDSNISDSGTLITLNSNSQVNGNLVVTGTVSATNLISGSSQISYPDLSNIPAGIVSGSSQITPLLPSGVVSGSSQVNADSITNFDTNVKDKLNADAVVSGSVQITKSLQDVTSVGNTTSTSISITNSTAATDKTTGALVVTGGIGTSGDIFAGGDVVAYASSDIRLKDNLELISNPLQKINQIGGYSFVWNEEKQDIYKGTDYGVIAQEIEEILPELVDTRENGYKAVKYDKLVSLLIEGIKDLSKQVEELKEKINKG